MHASTNLVLATNNNTGIFKITISFYCLNMLWKKYCWSVKLPNFV